MKKATRMIAAVLMIAGLGAGCGSGDKPEAVAKSDAAGSTNWAPEMAKEAEAHDPHDGQDHTGHNH